MGLQTATGATALLEAAAAAGVDTCFANPGTTEMPLVAALDRVPQIRAILGLFEGVCTGAADGYARLTRRPALTLLHLGPGFANGIANLHNARRARSAIVNLIGDQASWHLAADAPLTSDIVSLANPVSGWVRTAASAKAMPADIADAIAEATGPPGKIASYILPADFQAETVDAHPVVVHPKSPPRTASERIDEIAGQLRDAGPRGILLLGGAALGEAGQRSAARISAATGARTIVETFPAVWERGAGLPVFERLPYFPEQARENLSDAEIIVPAGALPPVAFFGYPGQPSDLAPEGSLRSLASPEEDVVSALEALASALGDKRAAPTDVSLPDAPSGPLNSATVGAALARCLPEGAIVMDESATTGLPFYAMSAGAPPHTLMTLTGGAIGQGLPVATGAAIACPDRKVIAFQADGSGAYTLQALWTQARENLDVVTLLCSNRAYRILQVELARAGIAEPGPQAQRMTQLDAPALDWVSLARGFGVPATRVDSAEALVEALPRALAEPGPQLIEMIIP
jgi:acetolactate synthase-1/2/3 large subunit